MEFIDTKRLFAGLGAAITFGALSLLVNTSAVAREPFAEDLYRGRVGR
jgi:hypothetical protein